MKFKVGDRVRLKGYLSGYISGSDSKFETSGILGTIEYISMNEYPPQHYLVKTDTKHVFFHSGGGRVPRGHGVWISEGEAELLPDRTFIVVKRTYAGQLLPAYKPYQHETRESAENEAVRLAKQNLGNDFVVFQMVTEVKTPVIPEPALNRLD